MKIIQKDILTVEEGIVVQSVNCQGVMGSGLAKQIRDKYPQVYESYKKYQFKLGQIQLVKITNQLYVCNLAGQEFYGRDSKLYTNYSAIREGLCKLQKWADNTDLSNLIYLPYNMGCGLGGGDWNVMLPIIEHYIMEPIICKLGD